MDLKLVGNVSRKLGPKFIGTFEELVRISKVAYKLKLPGHWGIHPLFHICKLRRFHATEEFGLRGVEPAKPMLVDDHEEYKVEAILNCKWNKRANGR